MSAAILVVGLLVVAAIILLERDRERARAARGIRVGNDSTGVLTLLGAPTRRCPIGSLEHVRDALPQGTARPIADETLQRLRQGTAVRWVWGDQPRCTPASGDTEVGFTRDGRVFWAVAEYGSGPALLP